MSVWRCDDAYFIVATTIVFRLQIHPGYPMLFAKKSLLFVGDVDVVGVRHKVASRRRKE